MAEFGSTRYKKITLSLALGSFLVFCNLYLFQPILPLLAKEFAVSETQINGLFAASTFALSIFLVPWAICSESFGRKKVMLGGIFSMPLIGLLMLLSDSFWLLLLTRGLMGVALAAFASVAVAYMVEELSPKAFGQAIGGYIAANSLGGISGRILGGTLTEMFSWQAAVATMAIFTFIGAVIVGLLLPNQDNFTPQRGLFFHHNRALVKHIKNKTLWFAMLIGGINFALFVNLYSVMGFRLVSAPHYLPIGAASLIFLCYLAGTLSSKLTGKWAQHKQPISGMVTGSIISMLGMWVALVDRLPMMVIGLLLVSFGAFFTHTLAYSWISQKAVHAKATATALYLVHYYVGGSLGGFFLIYCWQHGGWLSVTMGGMVLYIGLFALCYALYRQTVPSRTLADPHPTHR
ncbi:MFS transporter [Vibrio genomosp. F10]|uniref:MFS transporter n=1 Tax=Vibrio genomosp. F10 TaxID=723171 RepID=UPI00030FC53B|nr:MFS transporter [Vibrio genomosp. F10]OEF06697.1 MFS transporter permease [Vibrio genomosp. F10 str. 9ZB36]